MRFRDMLDDSAIFLPRDSTIIGKKKNAQIFIFLRRIFMLRTIIELMDVEMKQNFTASGVKYNYFLVIV